MKVFIVAAVLFASALAAPSISDNKVKSEGSMSKMMQYFGNCMESEDVAGCLAVKGITALNRAARASNIKITEGIVLARDPSLNARLGKAISENEIESSLPVDQEQRSSRLYDMAVESFNTFLASHNLQVKFPTDSAQEVSRAIDEGRGKLKKMIPSLLAGLIGKKIFAVLPLFLVGIALLSVKALITAKIAFLLAIVAALGGKGGSSGGSSGGIGGGLGGILGKVAGLSGGLGGGNSGGSYAGSTGAGYAQGGSQGWSSGSGSSAYPYARSYDEGQDLAYNGHVHTE